MREPPPRRWLHVRCLRPYCGREALIDPAARFGAGAGWPAAGLSRRFVCRCGGRAAHVSYGDGKPKPDNPCGWL
ncbi:MAG: hypothetical protein EON90_14850 [Brevundimonas sp.]|nr:MAG: hypothetical protein EON90_14850 [Brevundimonas sp.]